jgi:glutamyl-tRNA reductase
MVSLDKVENIFSTQQREQILDLNGGTYLSDGVLVSTCNRMELYRGEGFIPEEIVDHLFNLSSGLKSNFIGDTSIQGQVKDAYKLASENYSLNKSLHKLFQSALFVGKKVRNETNLSVGAITYSQAAVESLCQRKDLMKSGRVAIIGINALNEKIIRCLAKKGTFKIFILNRTIEKARILAEKYKCQALHLNQLNIILPGTDILISATSSTGILVDEKNFPSRKSMLILDLAVPGDIDKNIGNHYGVTLINLSQIEKQVNQNLETRHSDIEKAKAIVDKEVSRFMNLQYKWV